MSDWPHAKVTAPREVIAASQVMALMGVTALEVPPPLPTQTPVDPNAPTQTLATVSSLPAGGTSEGDGSFTQGTQVTVYATPAFHYVFLNWTYINGLEASRDATYTFILSSNTSLIANFEYRPEEYPVGVPWNVYRQMMGHMNSANLSRRIIHDYAPPAARPARRKPK